MATLEDAAEELVVKLRGLDSEIAESEGKLEELREQVEKAADDVEQQWSELREAVWSLVEKVREEDDQLRQRGQETAQEMADVQHAVAEDGAQARQELGDGRSGLEALGRHAADLAPEIEALATEAGEAPARSLSERARELGEELNRLVEEARDFLQDEVVGAADDASEQVRQVCETLHRSLAEAATEAFQSVYEEWEANLEKLEEYVVGEGYHASQQHARTVVEYVVEECGEGCGQRIDEVRQLVGVLLDQLRELTAEVERSAERVVATAGARLLQELEGTSRSAGAAVNALDGVKQALARYSFVEM